MTRRKLKEAVDELSLPDICDVAPTFINTEPPGNEPLPAAIAPVIAAERHSLSARGSHSGRGSRMTSITGESARTVQDEELLIDLQTVNDTSLSHRQTCEEIEKLGFRLHEQVQTRWRIHRDLQGEIYRQQPVGVLGYYLSRTDADGRIDYCGRNANWTPHPRGVSLFSKPSDALMIAREERVRFDADSAYEIERARRVEVELADSRAMYQKIIP